MLVGALLAAGVSAVTVQGCGSSSSSGDYMALCNQGCDKTATCLGLDAASCKQQCSSQTTMTMSCSNSAAIISAYKGCLAMDCSAFLGCVAGLPPCQSGGGQGGSSGGGQGGSSGGGTGGSTGNAGCSVCDKANSCCVALFTANQQSTASCAAFSASVCNAQTGTTQTQLISSCNQVIAAGAASNIAACR